VRVIAKRTLKEFWEKHRDCEQQLKSWYQEVSKAQWSNPYETLQDYPNARIIESSRMIFNIKGNHYRLIIKINFKFGMIWIRFIGTHSEYDKIDPNTV
jgi:mRNA interferase HigB